MTQMARTNVFLKAICELACVLLEPHILVLYVSQKKRGEKRKERMKGRKWDPVFKYKTRNDFLQSRVLQRGKVFMRMKQSVRLRSSSTQD